MFIHWCLLIEPSGEVTLGDQFLVYIYINMLVWRDNQFMIDGVKNKYRGKKNLREKTWEQFVSLMLIRYYFDPDSASVPFILVTGEKNI